MQYTHRSKQCIMGFVFCLFLFVGTAHADSCVVSQGYWKNHPEAWPVSSLTLGNTTYTESELIDILNTMVEGDATYTLAHQLIAVKLNIANGADDSTIVGTIADADTWLVANPIASNPTGTERDTGLGYKDTLENFNAGIFGNTHCGFDTYLPTATPTATLTAIPTSTSTSTPKQTATEIQTYTPTPIATSTATASPTQIFPTRTPSANKYLCLLHGNTYIRNNGHMMYRGAPRIYINKKRYPISDGMYILYLPNGITPQEGGFGAGVYDPINNTITWSNLKDPIRIRVIANVADLPSGNTATAYAELYDDDELVATGSKISKVR